MEVSAKRAKLWRKDIQGKNGVFHKYTVGISKKTQDGKFVNAYMPVVFSRKADAPDEIPNGALCDFEGFMSVESYTDRDGNARNTPQIVIMSVEFDDPTIGTSFEEAESDLPF